jgi:hypothetical protein
VEQQAGGVTQLTPAQVQLMLDEDLHLLQLVE